MSPADSAERSDRFEFRRGWWPVLAGIFVVSLCLRLYGGLTFGFDLDGPGTFKVINFDEGGSCRAVQGGFSYPVFIGHQVVALASMAGRPPADTDTGARAGKRYCQSEELILIQRGYSATAGALTVVLTAMLALMMWPWRPQIAWTVAALLGLSNFHIAQSHWGTADAPQVFFIVLLTAVITYGLVSGKRWPFLLSPLFLIAAIWAKLYAFAIFAYAFVLDRLDLRHSWKRHLTWLVPAALLGALLVLWNLDRLEPAFRRFIWGGESSRFGSGYAAIGTWRRWIRNAVNLPLVHIVGLGLPAAVFAVLGLRRAIGQTGDRLLWLVHAPAAAYVLHMLLLGPATYYRYYLPLFPTVALLSAYGFWQSRWARRKLWVWLFCLYPLLLTVDSEAVYRNDPRRRLGAWFEEHGRPAFYHSFYVSPPRTARRTALFDMDRYLRGGAAYLGAAGYVILSENWYDTAFANELNGPISWKTDWLIKTKPDHAEAYRRILSGRDPRLRLETEYDVRHFTLEFLLHRRFYGTFQLFVGDLKIFEVR